MKKSLGQLISESRKSIESVTEERTDERYGTIGAIAGLVLAGIFWPISSSMVAATIGGWALGSAAGEQSKRRDKVRFKRDIVDPFADKTVGLIEKFGLHAFYDRETINSESPWADDYNKERSTRLLLGFSRPDRNNGWKTPTRYLEIGVYRPDHRGHLGPDLLGKQDPYVFYGAMVIHSKTKEQDKKAEADVVVVKDTDVTASKTFSSMDDLFAWADDMLTKYGKELTTPGPQDRLKDRFDLESDRDFGDYPDDAYESKLADRLKKNVEPRATGAAIARKFRKGLI